jgi:hypothetical protein
MSLLFPSSSLPASDWRLPADKRPLPVIGWRVWRLRQAAEGVVLESLFGSERWDVGVTSAKCRRCPPWMTSQHRVPEVFCGCGLHAFSTSAEAVRHAERRLAAVFAGRGQPPPVVGAVVGWGRVVQHGSQGWRATYARPIVLLNTGQPLLEDAALRYGAPLVSMRGMCLLPLEFGEALTVA